MSAATDIRKARSSTGSARRRKLHTAPRGAISAAMEMGVYYKARCGRWVPPPPRVKPISKISDLDPDTCLGCERALRQRHMRSI